MINSIKEKGLTSNCIKIIAIMTMILDHVGYYYQTILPPSVYLTLRIIGRISMPLFVYLLVQGFFYTKNINKYITRIFVLGVITQVLTLVTGYINKVYYVSYVININEKLNILFSFALCLVLMKIIHEKVLVKKWDVNGNITLKIIFGLAILGIYLFIPIDYELNIPILAITMYFVEKLKIYIYIIKSKGGQSVPKIVINSIKESYIKLGYVSIIAIALLVISFKNINCFYLYIWMLCSLIPIYLYNNQRGKNTKITNFVFYSFFPIHHIIIYLLAMIMST